MLCRQHKYRKVLPGLVESRNVIFGLSPYSVACSLEQRKKMQDSVSVLELVAILSVAENGSRGAEELDVDEPRDCRKCMPGHVQRSMNVAIDDIGRRRRPAY